MFTDNEKAVVKSKLQVVINHLNEIDELKEDLKVTLKDVKASHGIDSKIFKKLAIMITDAEKRQKVTDENRLLEVLVDEFKD